MSANNDELRKQIDAVMTDMQQRQSELYGGQTSDTVLISSVFDRNTKTSKNKTSAAGKRKKEKDKPSNP